MIPASRHGSIFAMTGDSKQLIHSMFQAIPSDQRIEFLTEVLASLDVAEREELLANLPSKLQASKGYQSSEEDQNRALLSDATPAKNQLTAEESAREVERLTQLSQITFQNERAGLRKETLSCVLLCLLGFSVLIALGVGLGQGWAWLKQLILG